MQRLEAAAVAAIRQMAEKMEQAEAHATAILEHAEKERAVAHEGSKEIEASGKRLAHAEAQARELQEQLAKDKEHAREQARFEAKAQAQAKQAEADAEARQA